MRKDYSEKADEIIEAFLRKNKRSARTVDLAAVRLVDTVPAKFLQYFSSQIFLPNSIRLHNNKILLATIFRFVVFFIVIAATVAAVNEEPSTVLPSLLDHSRHSNSGVDLTRLFSDVSRTVSGIGTLLGGTRNANAAHHSVPQQKQQSDTGLSESQGALNPSGMRESGGNGEFTGAESESSLPFAGLFGGSNVCFKTCGMEDIQFAARRAGEMFMTMKVCMVVLTVITAVCAIVLTVAGIYFFLWRRNGSEDATGRRLTGVNILHSHQERSKRRDANENAPSTAKNSISVTPTSCASTILGENFEDLKSGNDGAPPPPFSSAPPNDTRYRRIDTRQPPSRHHRSSPPPRFSAQTHHFVTASDNRPALGEMKASGGGAFHKTTFEGRGGQNAAHFCCSEFDDDSSSHGGRTTRPNSLLSTTDDELRCVGAKAAK